MTPREQRGLEIAAKCKIEKAPRNRYFVQSQSSKGIRYVVEPMNQSCDCPDYLDRGEPCKHVFAVLHVIEREKNADGTVSETETIVVTKKKTYSQDWTAY